MVPDLPRYRRLLLTLDDLANARQSCERLLELDEFGHPTGEMTADFLAHLTRMVVAYARPFSGNWNPDLADPSPTGITDVLDEDETRLHGRIQALRDQEFAHSDPGPAQIKIYVGGDGSPCPISRVTRKVSVSRTEAGQLKVIIGKLENAVWEEIRKMDPLPPGEY